MAARHSSRRIPRSRSIRPARQAAPRSACRRSSARQLTGTVTLGTLMVNGVAVSLNSGTALSGTGSLLISNGTLTLGADLSVPSNVSLGLTSTTVNGGGQLTNSGVISADNATIGTALTNNSVITVVPNNNGSAFNGAFANNAGGTLVLETNSVGGSPAGKLTIANGFTNAGSIVLTDIGCCGGNTNTLTVASGILVNTGLITLTEGNSCGCGTRTLAAQLDNRGTLAALGSNTLTLSQPGANQTSSGTIELSLGSLAISSAASFTNSGTITVGASHTLTLGGVQLNNASGGTLSGGGTVAGDVSNAGTVDPGGPGTAGTLTITGTYTQTSTGVLNADIGGTTAGTQFDQLNVTGGVTLGGTLNVALINGFTPASGETFQVLTYGSQTGQFATIVQPPASSGVTFTPTYGATAFTMTAGAATTVISQHVVLSGLQQFANLEITSTGSITHAPGDATLKIEVAGRLQIDQGGSIDVSGMGCPQSQRWDIASGTCTGSNASSNASGGSYGGSGGGSSPNATYGDASNPNEVGSGGNSCCSNGGAGGGLVRVSAATLQLDGAIRADGQELVDGGGSGGGINVSVGTLSGSGTMSAKGALVQNGNYGSGGGGRIAALADDRSGFSGTLVAAGGSNGQLGGAGTIFSSTRSGGNPQLVVDDGLGTLTGAVTPVDALPGGTAVRVSNGARLINSVTLPGLGPVTIS